MSSTPKQISIDSDNGKQIASFGYYEGISYAKKNKLEFTTNFNDVYKGTHYIVLCGDVMIRVTENDFKEIKREVI